MNRTVCIVSMSILCLFALLSSQASFVLAQSDTEAPATQSSQGQLQEPLGFWATAVFVWVILLMALAFVIAMAWLSRSRRY